MPPLKLPEPVGLAAILWTFRLASYMFCKSL